MKTALALLATATPALAHSGHGTIPHEALPGLVILALAGFLIWRCAK